MKKIFIISVFIFVACKTSQFDYDKITRIELPASIQEHTIQDILSMEASRNQKIVVYQQQLYPLKTLDSIVKSLGERANITITKDSISGKKWILITSK